MQRPVDREARRHQDDGVDAGDVARELESLRRPRVAVDDADEEVRGEERPEEHHLGGDEEQHPEGRRAHARALVRDGRSVMFGGRCGRYRWTSSSSCVRAPLSNAWRAPGTPYSYGLPITCGISSKLKTGGGDVTCHSSVIARHGLPGASGPYFHEWMTL